MVLLVNSFRLSFQSKNERCWFNLLTQKALRVSMKHLCSFCLKSPQVKCSDSPIKNP